MRLSSATVARSSAKRPWMVVGAWVVTLVLSLGLAGALLSDAPRRRAMRARIEACGFLSGLPAALGHLARLADGSPAGQSRELDASGQPGDLDPRILVATQDLLTREYYEILSS